MDELVHSHLKLRAWNGRGVEGGKEEVWLEGDSFSSFVK